MDKIQELVHYKGYLFKVQRDDTENDSNWDGDISFTCYNSMHDLEMGISLTGVVLRPLWNLEWYDEMLEYKNIFKKWDYFQQLIRNQSGIRGLASILHDFLIDHGIGYNVYNVFSTLESEDNFILSEGAIKFWKRRIDEERALFDSNLDRFRILF